MILKRSEVIHAMESVKGAVPSKPFNPILAHVEISSDMLSAFDGEVGISTKLECPVLVPFNVRFETFFSLLKALSDEAVEIELSGKEIRVKCGRHKSMLSQIEDQLPLPKASSENWQPVPAGFKEALERARLVTSKSDQERVLSAVLISGDKIYATDRQQMISCTLEGASLNKMLIGRKAVDEIIRLGQPIRVALTPSWSIWDYGNLTLYAALREGADGYPPIEKMLTSLKSAGFGSNVGPLQPGLVAILTRLSLFGNRDNPFAKLAPIASGLELVCVSETSRISEWLDPVPSAVPKGFDPSKLSAAVTFGDTIDWGANPHHPIMIRGAVCKFEYLLSPMVG